MYIIYTLLKIGLLAYQREFSSKPTSAYKIVSQESYAQDKSNTIKSFGFTDIPSQIELTMSIHYKLRGKTIPHRDTRGQYHSLS